MNNEGNNNLDINDINLINNGQNNLDVNNQNIGFSNQVVNSNINSVSSNNQINNINNIQNLDNNVASNQGYVNNISNNVSNNNQFNNINSTDGLQNLNNNNFNNIVDNNITKQSKNNKIIIIVIIVVVVLLLLFGIIKLFGGSFLSGNGKTVKAGQLLKVEELDGEFDFQLDVLDDLKIKDIDNFYYKGKGVAVKVSIKNNSAETLSLLNIKVHFKLLDADDNELFGLNQFIAFSDEGSIKNEIPSGKSDTGYLYFYDVSDELGGVNIDISKVNKLQMSIVGEESYVDGIYNADFENYYVKFK